MEAAMDQQVKINVIDPEAIQRDNEARLFKIVDYGYTEELETDQDGATEDLASIIAAARGDLGID
jgi:hypothetical protein